MLGLPIIGAVADSIKGLIGLADQYIEDKDKKNEFLFKAFEVKAQIDAQLIGLKTIPWVDALVKIMYAVQSLWRPFVGGLMTAFGAYAHYSGIPMEASLHAIFDGAFPAWGISRHIAKSKNGH